MIGVLVISWLAISLGLTFYAHFAGHAQLEVISGSAYFVVLCGNFLLSGLRPRWSFVFRLTLHFCRRFQLPNKHPREMAIFDGCLGFSLVVLALVGTYLAHR